MLVETKDIHSARDFLAALVLDTPESYHRHSRFLFRGVSNGSGVGEHRLIPSALRPSRFTELQTLSGTSPTPANTSEEFAAEEWIQAKLENNILGLFFRYADGLGLPMPEISAVIRRTLQLPQSSEELASGTLILGACWPPDELLPLAAQAQHYGLPTRLLDWSRDPWTAAYFAAKGALAHARSCPATEKTVAHIAVWLLNVGLLEHLRRLAAPGQAGRKHRLPLDVVTAPSAMNVNLRAQQGLFTVWRPRFEQKHRQKTDRRPLDELLAEAFDKEGPPTPLLYKYTLETEHVEELWHLIRRNGVNAASLFPDFSGAAQAVREAAKIS